MTKILKVGADAAVDYWIKRIKNNPELSAKVGNIFDNALPDTTKITPQLTKFMVPVLDTKNMSFIGRIKMRMSRIGRFFKKNKNEGIVLHGKPGSGKKAPLEQLQEFKPDDKMEKLIKEIKVQQDKNPGMKFDVSFDGIDKTLTKDCKIDENALKRFIDKLG